MKKEKVNWRIVVAGLFCLTAVEMLALTLGYNGTMLKAFIAIVALAIGVTIPNPIKLK